MKRLAVGAALIAALMGPGSGHAAESVRWDPGNGVEIGSRLWIAGDVTVSAEVPETGPAAVEIDDVSLLARYEAAPRLALLGELRLDDLVEAVEGEGTVTGTGDVTLERLYAELLLTPSLTLRVGKFYTPFGLWNVVRRAPLTWTVERPAVTEDVFPQHATGLSLLHQTTWRGWSLDAAAYGPAQDELAFRRVDEDDLDEDGLMFGGRVAAGRVLGFGFAALGVNAASFRRHDRSRWTTVAGLDLELGVAGQQVTGELTFKVPPDGGRVVQGMYLQDVVPLRSLLPVARELYGVVRFEQLQPRRGSSAVGGLLGLFWRPMPPLVLRTGYFFTNRTLDDFEPGLRVSVSLLF